MEKEGRKWRGGENLQCRLWNAHLSQVLALPRLFLWPVYACYLICEMEAVGMRDTRKNTHKLQGTDVGKQLSMQKHHSQRGSDLLFQRHDKDPSDFEKALHVLLMLFLHTSPAIHSVILRTLWRNLQAISSNKGRFTEFKPESKECFP